MGVCKLPRGEHEAESIHRRIDIKVYPRSCYAFALLFFTGSEHFNRSMRHYAHHYRDPKVANSTGFTLSDIGLNPYFGFYQKSAKYKSPSLKCATEEDVFKALDLKYKLPRDRNVFEVDNLIDEAAEEGASIGGGGGAEEGEAAGGEEDVCEACSKPLASICKSITCSKCLTSNYCSLECQKSDLKRHEQLCDTPDDIRSDFGDVAEQKLDDLAWEEQYGFLDHENEEEEEGE